MAQTRFSALRGRLAAAALTFALAAGFAFGAAAQSSGTASGASSPAAGARQIDQLPGTDLPGFDYQVLREIPLSDCEAACLGDPVCRAYTYNTKAQWCFLKSDVGAPKPFSSAMSGRVIQSTAAAPAAAPLPLPPLDFVPSDVVTEASRFRSSVAAAARLNRDAGTVKAGLAAALVGGGASAWLDAGMAILGEKTDDYSRQYALRRDAASAAYIGLTLASTKAEQARALALLSLSFEAQSLWRAALDSLKESLALAPDPALQAHYDSLREQYGFRILDYRVDSDTASPRVCIQFSENLPKGRTDFSKYVVVAGQQNPAVSATGQELCVDGLKHGERYEVTIRSGVPSTVGENLLAPASYTIYVRDRRAAVRFPSNAYVLPRTGANGVPVVSVNTDKVMLDLMRVGDRALVRTIVDGSFKSQLESYQVDQIANDTGAKVWSGEMDVKRVLNTEVTTAFPVDEALKTLAPGVYVLAARPQEQPSDTGGTRATQWFIVSDLGLATFSGADGIHAFVRSLATAKAVNGAEVRLIARNDDVLGTATTDAMGHAAFPPGLGRGTGGMTPSLLVASTKDGDYAFLDLTAPSFDLTDRGVAGRVAPGPLDAFLYTERGVYRPGEVVHLTGLLRTADSHAPPSVPLTFVVERPDGVVYQRALVPDQGLGGRSLDVNLVATAQRGTWRINAFSDPKADPIGSVTFLVEDFVPVRMSLDLATKAKAIGPGQPVPVSLDANYLYGAPGSDLSIEGEILVTPATGGLAGFDGFHFGLVDDTFTPVRRPLFDLGRTDAKGHADVSVKLPSLDPTTQPLSADVILRVREAGGRAIERTITLPVATQGPRLGIKPQFAGGQVGQGATAGFEVVAVAPDGSRTALPGAAWQLVKLDREYQWYNRDGRWDYFTTTSTERVASGTVDVAADGTVQIAAPVTWGNYRLEITSPGNDNASASYEFSAGWIAVGASADTPDVLEVGLDKTGYRPGDTATLHLKPQFAGTALVAVVADKLLHLETVEVPADGADVKLTVGPDWTPGAYVVATLYRPMDVKAGRMPARAIGLDWLGTDKALGSIGVTLAAPAEMRPRETLKVPVTLTGLDPGEEAYVTVAAVDVGILNLTRYEPPDPITWFLGQRRLGAAIRDLYGSLIDSLSATRGTIRTGGDQPAPMASTTVATQELVARYSGLLKVGPDGKATAEFAIPAFNGTVKVMAVAWSKAKVGQANADVIVRDPVVVTGSLPRVMAPGDESRLRLDFDNVSGPAGDYAVAVKSEGPVSAGTVAPSVTLAEHAKATLEVPLATAGVGTATLSLTVTAPNGEHYDQTFRLNVRPAAPPSSNRSLAALSPGESLEIGADRLEGLVPDGARLSLSVSAGFGIDVPGLLADLDRYPYGCAEQTTSRTLPLLYFNSVAASIGFGTDDAIHKRVQTAIERLLQFQSASGSFGLWGPNDANDMWLDAYITDFLTRARAKGYQVPDQAFSQALDRLQNDLSYNSNFEEGGGGAVAYTLYVLARNGRASIGDLRYFADDKLASFGTGLAQAQIAAGLAFYGDEARSKAAFETAAETLLKGGSDNLASFSDYGTPVRDAAAALALVAEAGNDQKALAQISNLLQSELGETDYASTQEAAWMLLAANALSGPDAGLKLAVDGAPQKGAVFRRVSIADLTRQPITVTNNGKNPVAVTVTAEGVPLEPEPADSNDITLTRDYYHLDGTPFKGDHVGQNERLIAVLTIKADAADAAPNLIVADLLPGGFEIENPDLVTSADLSAFPWLSNDVQPAHTEFRDDRFVAAFGPGTDLSQGVTVAYMVRAVSPGRFAWPAALAEDMYALGTFARTAPGTLTVTAAKP